VRFGFAPLLLALCALAAAPAPATVAAAAGPCAGPRIGFLGPITGAAAFLGKEQLGFARYAVRTVGHREVRLVEEDTQLDPARARKAAARLHANPDVLAVVGPAGSQEVLAVAPVLGRRSRLAFVSGSALGAALTNGSIRHFFRVVPSERAQAPTVARFLRTGLEARRVAIVEDGSTYSRALGGRVQASLQRAKIDVTRLSVPRGATRFAAVVARVPADADAVFLPWQIAANAQAFGEDLRRQGSTAVLVGADAVDNGDFMLEGSYVTSFAPDVRALPRNEPFVAGYGVRFASRFGPPAYVAAQAAILAVRKACADGDATRSEVERNLRATSIRRIVLGGGLRFTSRGDRKGAAYSVFRIGAGGKRVLVR
jgi:branched-chain amino acid transport system substrate-binding protein